MFLDRAAVLQHIYAFSVSLITSRIRQLQSVQFGLVFQMLTIPAMGAMIIIRDSNQSKWSV